jgi:subtilase family serine protease
MVPPCLLPWWDIMALATIANIGQIAVKEPFTVRVLLNGRIIPEEEITELTAVAQQIIVALETVYSLGLYTVTVIVNPGDKIKERDETNNIAERSINIQ